MANTNAGDVLSGVRASAASASVYSSRVLSTRDAVLDIKPEWDALCARQSGPTAFQSHAFCMAWMDANVFCQNAKTSARIITIRNMQGALVALFPLAVSNSRILRTAEWIGEPLIQYGDALIDPQADAEAIRVALSNATGDDFLVDAFHFRKVRKDSRIQALLDLKGVQVGEAEDAAIIDLDAHDSYDAYAKATFSNRSRKNRRKKRRTLEAEGTLSFDIADDPAKVREILDTALRWKREWLAERGLTSRAFADEHALSTLVDVADTPGTNAVAGVLRLNGAPVSVEFGFLDDYGFLAYLGSYNPAYDHLSPGKIAMEEMARALMDRGYARYDLLAPNSEYKKHWTEDTHPVADYFVPLSIMGLAYRSIYLNLLRSQLKDLSQKAPPWLVSAGLRARNSLK